MADISFTDKARTGFVTLQPFAFQATQVHGDPGVIDRVQADGIEAHAGLTWLSSSSELSEKRQLENAKVVVVGGAGLGDIDCFGLVRDLAAATGGEVGATRPPVLQHWVDEDRLIGQTGKAVQPELLFSIGTSGALQYTAGILEAETIVAVNRDQHAPIFQIADLGIVADAKSLLPMLTAKIRQVTMRRLADILQAKEKTRDDTGFGAQVRRLRESHKWSLETLAEATGQSPEFIEKVEIEAISPPVSFLLRLAAALEVDPGTFLRKEERTLIRNMRAQAFVKRTQNYSYQTLSPGAENDHLRAFMVTIEPKQTHKPVAYKHEGEEFIFVMEGDLGLALDNKVHHLTSGESIHFNSDVPHKLKSISNDPTRCIVVLYTP
jgi:transcriptional regulator with XRE-family HTH domain